MRELVSSLLVSSCLGFTRGKNLQPVSSVGMKDLPVEMLFLIFNHLQSKKDQFNFAATSKYYMAVLYTLLLPRESWTFYPHKLIHGQMLSETFMAFDTGTLPSVMQLTTKDLGYHAIANSMERKAVFYTHAYDLLSSYLHDPGAKWLMVRLLLDSNWFNRFTKQTDALSYCMDLVLDGYIPKHLRRISHDDLEAVTASLLSKGNYRNFRFSSGNGLFNEVRKDGAVTLNLSNTLFCCLLSIKQGDKLTIELIKNVLKEGAIPLFKNQITQQLFDNFITKVNQSESMVSLSNRCCFM